MLLPKSLSMARVGRSSNRAAAGNGGIGEKLHDNPAVPGYAISTVVPRGPSAG